MNRCEEKDRNLLKLEAWLSRYDKVFFVRGREGYETLTYLLNSKAFRNYWGKVLFLLPDNEAISNCVYERLSQVEVDWLEKLYYTYEFSDKFKILGTDARFGSLQNYHKAGLMTTEQVCEALMR